LIEFFIIFACLEKHLKRINLLQNSTINYLIPLMILLSTLFTSYTKEYHDWDDETLFGINKLKAHSSFFVVESLPSKKLN
tara:strand:+ start:287 stop:526 length:240 start_codon:yes stop_codon:yes gene_type:complete